MVWIDRFIDIRAPAAAGKPLQTTVFVAASNARDEEKAQADFVCDGINDGAIITQAINSLPYSGGIVKLSEGTFYLGGQIEISRSFVVLEGTKKGTILYCTAQNTPTYVIAVEHPTEALWSVTVKDIIIHGNNRASYGIYFCDSTYCSVENCEVHNCIFDGIYFLRVQRGTVINNISRGNGIGIFFSSSKHCSAVGNIVYTSDFNGIELNNSFFCAVTSNIVLQNSGFGISIVSQSSWNTVCSNIIDLSGKHGIYMSAAVKNVISSNVLMDNSRAGDNLYDDIYMSNASSNVISSNVMEAGLTYRTRYAINEDYGDANIFIGNRMLGQATGGLRMTGANSLDVGNLYSATH